MIEGTPAITITVSLAAGGLGWHSRAARSSGGIPIDQRPDQRLAVDEDTKAQKPIALTSAIAGL